MKNQKNNISEVVFIIDRSGSMSGLESDTIGGFNSMLAKQKKLDGKAYVSTVLFNHESEVVHDRVDISRVKEMTSRDYFVGGCTALIDALGGAIKHTEMIHRYVREEDVPEHTMFVIITDGYENASSKFSSSEVKALVEQKKELGWEFLFLGANIDAVETARTYGISEDRAVDYQCDSEGTQVNFAAVSDAVCAMRCSAPITSDWSKDIKNHYRRSKKRR